MSSQEIARLESLHTLRRRTMELIPELEFGWLNGWIPLGLLVFVEGFLLLIFSKKVVTRLFDRSTWSRKQAIFTGIGKLFSLTCIVLIIFTSLKLGTGVFIAGVVIYALGLIGLVVAIVNFRRTPIDRPVTEGLYKVSRHPQIVMLFVAFLGMCLAIGSWSALLALLLSRLLQHLGILAEEEACLAQYGESYWEYMKRVPRYLLFF
jgi:protein-S-isoprenylcysteine O-methyltransferase Ste14